jgi:geranylgeranyl pyrophosphate synthase
VTSIEDYIKKSRDKTALLFQTGILAGLLLSEEKDNEELKKTAIEFSENFGIAFQIRDDLINITSENDLKPSQNDFASGIYTAPIIFATQENANFLEENDFSKLKKTKAIEKTKDLMDTYFNKSISALTALKDSKYQLAIIKLIEILKSST